MTILGARRSPGDAVLAALIVVAAALLAALFPADAPFINDEPRLLSLALDHNGRGELARVGLMGTMGLRYGPVPIWFYQAALALSHDPVVLVWLKALATVLVMAVALWVICREADLPRAAALLALLSPFFWLYARLLWDNTLAIPLGAIAVAALVRFWRTRGAMDLAVIGVALLLLPLIHLMTVALVVPIAWSLLRHDRAVLGRGAPRLVLIGLALLGLGLYTFYGSAALAARSGETHRFALDGFVFPFLGFRLLSVWGVGYFFDRPWSLDDPFVTLGIVGAVVAAVGMACGLGKTVGRQQARDATVAGRLARLLLGIFVAQILLDGFTASFRHPHYYNGTWVLFPLLFALGVRTWGRRGGLVVAGLALVLLTSTTLLLVRLHATQGTRGPHYGPTLGQQLAVASEVRQYLPASSIEAQVDNIRRFPHALRTLVRLLGPVPTHHAPRRVRIVYANPSLADDGRLDVEDAAPGVTGSGSW